MCAKGQGLGEERETVPPGDVFGFATKDAETAGESGGNAGKGREAWPSEAPSEGQGGIPSDIKEHC